MLNATIYCKSCRYNLSGLAAGVCPECANPFDPARPETYAATSRPPTWPFVVPALAGAACVLLFPVLVHVLLVVARLELGRWPHRWGMDDPKGVPLVRDLMMPAYLTVYLLPVGAVVVVFTLLAAAIRRRGLATVYVFTIALATGLLFLLAIWDPARAMVWFFD